MARSIPLSVLDLATIGRQESVADALAGTVVLAQRAEALGYRRVWYAEHHNMPTIGSSATAVLIAHVAAHTSTIRLGAGGVMLPNHAPLVVAEQFGTLETLHPGRIDLGLGRAPGTDPQTLRALRRGHDAAETFPQDLQELQGYLSGNSLVPGVAAIPGQGTDVPLYLLGSSLFGATLAAALGLPYAFASHFAPEALEVAVAAYRRDFRPSEQLDRPHVIAGVNVFVAETDEAAQEHFTKVRRRRALSRLVGRRELSDTEAEAVLRSPQGRAVADMLRYSAVGAPATVKEQLDDFAEHADADELVVVHNASNVGARLRSIDLLGGVTELVSR